MMWIIATFVGTIYFNILNQVMATYRTPRNIIFVSTFVNPSIDTLCMEII